MLIPDINNLVFDIVETVFRVLKEVPVEFQRLY